MHRYAIASLLLAAQGCSCEADLRKKHCEYEVVALSARAGTTTVDFGRVPVRSRKTTTVEITNTGSSVLDRMEVQWRQGTGEILKAQFESLPIIAEPIVSGETRAIEITYHPIIAVAAGGQAHRGSVRVSHPDFADDVRCPDPVDIALVGRSFEPPPPPIDAGVTDGPAGFDTGDTGFHDAGRPDYGPPIRLDGGFPLFTDGHFKAAYAGQQARAKGAAIQLDDGRLVLVGGINRDGVADNTIEVFDPASGTPTWHGPMAVGRIYPALALLADGRVMISGGLDNAIADRARSSASAEIFNPDDGTISAAGELGIGRYGHTMSRAGATIVVLGGLVRTPPDAPGADPTEVPAVAVEIYSPGTNTWDSPGIITAPRWFHTATELAAEQVLLLGGMSPDGIRQDGEVFSGAVVVPLQVGLYVPRLGHSATRIDTDGQTEVMIIGGHDGENVHRLVSWLTPTVVPGQASIEQGIELTEARYGHSTVALDDGTILVMGGVSTVFDYRVGPQAARQDAERFVGVLSQWLPLANRMTSRRYHGFAGVMPDGAFIVGGSSMVGRATAHTNAERFLRATARFSSYGLLGPRHAKAASGDDMTFFGGIDLHTGRVTDRVRSLRTGFSDLALMRTGRADAAAVLLQGDDDSYLIIGGRDEQGQPLHSVEIWTADEGGELTGSLHIARSDHAAYLLDNGKVLVAGGLIGQADPTDTLEVYDPFTRSWTMVDRRMNVGRYRPSLAALPGGLVLLHGGTDPQRGAMPVDLFNPVDNSLASPDQHLPTARRHHGHAAIQVGNIHNVLFAGGEIWRGDGEGGGYRAAADADLYIVSSGVFAQIPLSQTRRGPAVVPLGQGMVLIAGGNRETGGLPGLPLEALNSAEILNLDDLQTNMMEAQLTMPRAFPTAVAVGEGVDRNGYVAGGIVYDGTSADRQEIITPLTGIEYSAEGPPPTR